MDKNKASMCRNLTQFFSHVAGNEPFAQFEPLPNSSQAICLLREQGENPAKNNDAKREQIYVVNLNCVCTNDLLAEREQN